jgi:tRNA(Leu) C34 or U34 (ribose-2'-O)-methylase TrmL
LFLDPATAAELRQVLGPVGFPLDPDALDRAAANLHARARALTEQARVLRAQSHAP